MGSRGPVRLESFDEFLIPKPQTVRRGAAEHDKAVEDEAAGLFGLESLDDHVLYAKRAELLLAGGEGMRPRPAKAVEDFNAAAEAAMEIGKGKLANKYYERAGEAEAAAEEAGEEEDILLGD
eukprot:CAMPEP_0182852468 /NCGR_PEP_ID=MMETSP0034_2-20130328/178_1 /TAXON_ID=156128 /ORGANISM="Nephroselmis pyriformis, Strain CCMP717" /LENGTH=121 /DNA_ID=CAMNT_0024983177 /DNA_START=98 /DNA_END=464 /DNA_ORIENTATION=+